MHLFMYFVYIIVIVVIIRKQNRKYKYNNTYKNINPHDSGNVALAILSLQIIKINETYINNT